GNTLSLISNRGITAGSSATNVTVSGNTISDNNGFGVAFGTSAAGVTVSGNTISGGSTGVDFSSGASTVTISGNTISDVSFDGVQVSGLSTSVTVSGNVFQGAIGVDLIGLLGGDYAGDNNRNETTSIGGVVCDDTRSGDIYGPGPGIAITGEATRCGVPGVRP
ncbi:MAG: right-handed parallel beta-helix repeat-containing protein, partial [Alphaproteobacteria bacterium]